MLLVDLFCIIVPDPKLNNFQAAKLLQSLYQEKNSTKLNKTQRKRIINEATSIYDELENKKSVDVIHKLLKLYLCLGFSRKVEYIWNDIKRLDKTKLEYSVLIKCCLDSNNIDLCLEALGWMESSQRYTLRIHDGFIKKLLLKCGDNMAHITFIHRLIEKGCIENNNILMKTTLINIYGALNEMDMAWNVYTSIAEPENDIICRMTMMKLCCGSRDIDKGALVLQEMRAYPLINTKMKTSMIAFYGICGDIDNARRVFNETADKDRDLAMIAAMMCALVDSDYNTDALHIYHQHHDKYANTDCIIAIALKACIAIGDHKSQCLKLNTALIDFYGCSKDVDAALTVFNAIADHQKDVICVGAMMKCFINNGCSSRAIKLYNALNEAKRNTALHSLAIKAYANTNEPDKAHNIIDALPSSHKTNVQLSSAMIYFYGKSNEMNKARDCYDAIRDDDKGIVMVNYMLYALHINGYNEECLQLFSGLNLNHLKPNIVTFIHALTACANGALVQCALDIYNTLNTKANEWMLSDVSIQICLMNTFGVCAMIDECKQIFSNAKQSKNIAVWNTMMKVCGDNGLLQEANDLYFELRLLNIVADKSTYSIIINIYSHCDELEKAIDIWRNHIKADSIKFDKYIISSLLYILSNKGLFDEAHRIIQSYNRHQES